MHNIKSTILTVFKCMFSGSKYTPTVPSPHPYPELSHLYKQKLYVLSSSPGPVATVLLLPLNLPVLGTHVSGVTVFALL